MLTAEGCAARRQRLWDSLPEPCDVLLITSPESLVYLAGHAPSPFVFRSVESAAAAALVLRPGHATLLVDNLLQPFADRSFVDETIVHHWYSAKETASHRGGCLIESLADSLPEVPGENLGVEYSSVPAGLLDAISMKLEGESCQLQDLDTLIRSLRRAKDPDELAVIRRSVRAGESAHARALAVIEPGMTELDAFLIVQEAATRDVGEPVLVYGDFASGPRCATERGGPPTCRVIERGDLLLLDFSVVVQGYRADFTNTFVVGGEPTNRQMDMYRLCMGALEAGESLLSPGRPAREVDQAVRRHFAEHKMEEYFPSHTGHGLGLGHPEPPYLVRESEETLAMGDVVALEPGLYVPGAGGMRFERNYLITRDGHVTLTRHRLGLSRSP